MARPLDASVGSILILALLGVPAVALTPQPEVLECKMLLSPDRFADRLKGCKELWEIVRKTAKAGDIDVDEDGFAEEPARYLWFLDTSGFDLYRRGFILRRRQASAPARADRGVAFELAFKFRGPDASVVEQQDVRPAEETGGESSYELDVVATETGARRLYCAKGEIRATHEPGGSVASMARLFPGIAGIPLLSDPALSRVNDRVIEERVYKPGALDFGKHAKARVTVTVWYRKGETRPLIAEVSYKFKSLADLSGKGRSRVEEGERFLLALSKALKAWHALGQTKTGLIYKLHQGDQE